jgi:hypothetical protein
MSLHNEPGFISLQQHLDAHKSGVKYDSGKTRTGLMFTGFASALNRVAEVTTFGANKYTPNGWLSVPSASERYTDALYRHLLAGATEKFDLESGIEHLAHAAWNILAVLELQLRKELATHKESETQI